MKKLNWNYWDKLVAIVALVNLTLVIFNLTYLPLRSVYVYYVPALAQSYDPIKGIEPSPDAEAYLDTVDRLTTAVYQSGLEDDKSQTILSELRQQSQDLLVENPFSIANQFGTFAKLQRRIEQHLGVSSAQNAFRQFWTVDYLSQAGWQQEIAFFDNQIRPLLEINYFRATNEFGQLADNFWQLDLYFMIFLGIDFLGRTLIKSIRTPQINWFDAILRNWYDLLFFLPTWRLLRVIPTLVRCHKSKLFDLEKIMAQVTHEPAAYLSDRVSAFLVVRLISQAQETVKSGQATQFLVGSQQQSHVQVGIENKVDAIVDRILRLSIYRALPQVQPDLEEILRHSMKGALQESDVYQLLKGIPGFANLPTETVNQFSDYLAEATCQVLASSYSDVEGREKFDEFSQNFKQALRRELQNKEVQAELEGWISDWLEELKLNYAQAPEQKDPESILTEAEQIRGKID